MRGKKVVLLWLGMVSVLFNFGCVQNVGISDAISMGSTAYSAATLSDEDVKKEAAVLAKNTDENSKIASKNSKYTKRLNKLVKNNNKLGDMDLVYKVYISDEVNAFAYPDGNIRIYSGLMDLMSDDEVIFVIGHEIGHVYNKHSLGQMRQALLTRLARQGAAVQGGVGGQLAASELGGLGEELLNAQFSQSDEYEADEYAVKFMAENNYNPMAGYTTMLKFLELSSGSNEYSFFSSHPPTQERADKIKKLSQEMGY
jgi:putative metalloprotease